ncbi:AMP-binding protein [Frankia sp. AgB32]|nr:AMP-binding protein [Frankia sp. AgB32]
MLGLPSVATLGDALRAQAQSQPEQYAFRFLTGTTRFEDGSAGDVVTYAALDTQARTIAAALGRRTQPGDRALLLYAPGPQYIAAYFGCLYAGVVAVPAYPPDAGRSLSTLLGIVRDAQPTVFLTSSDILDLCRVGLALEGDVPPGSWLATDTVDASPEEFVSPDGIGCESLAFLQYTSGSTGDPRGVMVSHANLLANIGAIAELTSVEAASRLVSWLPPYHDMGLIGAILTPICAGVETILISPADFLRDPLRWLEAISHFRATYSVAPDFAYGLCTRKADATRTRNLDLSRWKVALNGAEPVRTATLADFEATFGPCGFSPDSFRPVYGLAEATLLVSAPAPGAARRRITAPDTPTSALVSVGREIADTHVRIVDPQRVAAVPDGEIGEIWISGPGVAQGYWNRPRETELEFRATLPGHDRNFLRTGDLGLVEAGELYIAGRLKDMIVIRGRNYFPQDLESAAWSADSRVRPGCVAAFGVTTDEQEQLVVAAECGSPADASAIAEISRNIRAAISRKFGVVVHDVVLLQRGSIPKTSSGKIRRSVTATAYRHDDLSVIARSDVADGAAAHTPAAQVPSEPLGTISDKVSQALAAALGLHTIGPDVDFFAVGGDSLRAVEATAIAAELGVSFEASLLYSHPSVRELTEAITQSPDADGPARSATAVAVLRSPIARVGDAESYPLSSIQRRWAGDYLVDRERTWGNISQRLQLGEVDVERLAAASRAVWLRHESLRTVFPELDGELRQVIRPDCDVPIDVHDLRDRTAEERGTAIARIEREAAGHVFDLANGPLTRATLVRTDAQSSLLLLTAHHMIADGWSFLAVAKQIDVEFAASDQAPMADPTSPAGPRGRDRDGLRYRDYSAWMNRLEASGLLDESRRYWRSELSGELPVTMPVDDTIARYGSSAGASVVAALPADLVDAVRAAVANQRVGISAVLYAAFFAAVSGYTGNEDLIIGTPLAGRDRSDIRDMVGMFINLVPIRLRVKPELVFADLAAQVQLKLLGAVVHQRWQLDRMAQEIGVDRQPHLFPFTNTFFTTMEVGGDMPLPVGTAPFARDLPVDVRFHMMFYAYQFGSGIAVECRYRAALFDAASITSLVEDYLDVLRNGLLKAGDIG